MSSKTRAKISKGIGTTFASIFTPEMQKLQMLGIINFGMIFVFFKIRLTKLNNYELKLIAYLYNVCFEQ